MASYRNPELREKLAAEFVIGTLRGRARARFTPLAAAAGGIAPPARVWQAVANRIAGAASGAGARPGLSFWRGLAMASTAFALMLAAFIGVAPRPEPPMAMVAVMNDEREQPALVVSWPPMKSMRDPYVRIRVVQAHPVMAPGTAWEMWMVPGGKAAPVSMGLITTDADQTMRLKPALAARMEGAWGIAMSVEPEGGSRTGAPTGPVIFKGQCVKIL